MGSPHGAPDRRGRRPAVPHAVLEEALDAGGVPEVLRPRYREALGHALLVEHAAMLGILEGSEESGCRGRPGHPLLSLSYTRPGRHRCEECRERKGEAIAAAKRRRRLLSDALALTSLPTAVAGLYAFGLPDLGLWWGLAGFLLAGGCLVVGWLIEERR